MEMASPVATAWDPQPVCWLLKRINTCCVENRTRVCRPSTPYARRQPSSSAPQNVHLAQTTKQNRHYVTSCSPVLRNPLCVRLALLRYLQVYKHKQGIAIGCEATSTLQTQQQLRTKPQHCTQLETYAPVIASPQMAAVYSAAS
jgi:hypothetical protein